MDPLPKTTVRSLEAKDVEAIVALDARIVGRRRDGYLRPKLAEALKDVGIRASLVVEHDGRPAGFLLAKVWYGEFGELDPVAVLDTIGVDPLLRAHGLATEMLDQLRMNLAALGIRTLLTEVSWKNPELLTFFHREGFVPAQRLCLEADPGAPVVRARRVARLEREGGEAVAR